MFRASLTPLALLLLLLETANGWEDAKQELVLTVNQVDRDGAEKPLVGAFVFVPPTPYLKATPKIAAWLQENAQPPKPQVHRFSLVEEQIVPQRAIFYVGDSVHRRLGDGVVLDMELVDNQPDSGINPDYTFRHPERTAARLKAIGTKNCKDAFAHVSDHTLNGITDKNGQVAFLRIPPMESIPFRIYPALDDGKRRYHYSSPTLTFSKQGSFALDASIETHVHTIYCKEIPQENP